MQGVDRVLTRFDLATGKLPEAGRGGRRTPPGGQQRPRRIEIVDDRRRYDQGYLHRQRVASGPVTVR